MDPSKTAGTIYELITHFKKAKEVGTLSLPEYTKDVGVYSKLYIEKKVTQDEIILPLVSALNQIYVGFILTAVNLDQMVLGGKTVRDALKTVSTEAYVDVLDEAMSHFAVDAVPSVEAQVSKIDEDAGRFASGKLVELEFGTDNDNKIKVYINCQLLPNLITSDVSSQIIEVNYTPPTSRRFKKAMAGEISFFQDFILARDLVEKQKKALKTDDTGVLFDMALANKNKLFKALTGVISGNTRHNLANSLFVIDAATFKKATNDSSINFDNFSVRQKLFSKSGMMMMAVVDSMYNQVDIYYNGIKHKGSYDFGMFKKIGKSNDADMKQLIQMFAGGMAPQRF